jgi:hypothetical protein
MEALLDRVCPKDCRQRTDLRDPLGVVNRIEIGPMAREFIDELGAAFAEPVASVLIG